MFITRDVFRKVRGFNGHIMTNEDCDLCYRIRQQGYTIYSDAGIEAMHLGTPQTIAGFFRKEQWHGRDVFRVFLQSGRARKNLNAVLYGLFYLAGMIASGLGVIAAFAYGSPVLLIT